MPRLLLMGAGLVAVLLFLAQGVALPWSSGCSVTGRAGAILAEGTPAQVAELIDTADDEVEDALVAGPAVSCRVAPIGPGGQAKERPLGLTPRAQELRGEVRQRFGHLPDGGFGPDEPLPGRRVGGEHSLGRAIDFFFRPHEDPQNAEAGWRLANWAVANAERLGVRTVIYRDRIWSARRSAQGWREYEFGGRDPRSAVNRHLDHVHVDVA